MNPPTIRYCPGTLAEGFDTYSRTARKKLFGGIKVSHILPYESPASNKQTTELFEANKQRMSISGVQEKFSMLLDKNKLRLVEEGEQGQYILKPIPLAGKQQEQMPANEHLTMQIAKQVFGLETAENALVFFQNGDPAFITKRFDIHLDGSKKAQEDFTALSGRTPQTHGENYKYLGSYLDLFVILKKFVPAYPVEAPKLFKIILFNYLMSNGDAHYKNFSIIETTAGDFRLSPAYDLLNSRLHIEDRDFALEEGLLPKRHAKGKIREQFYKLGELSGIPISQIIKIVTLLTSRIDTVKEFIEHSFLSDRTKRSYAQAYLTRLHKLTKQ